MGHLAGKRILLGVTGGIAAYKAAELTRRLTEAGAELRVCMTRGATAFVTPLTFQALSGHPVRLDLLDATAESAMDHIHLARWAELVLIAPASANFMAKLRAGLADDLLTTLCLATESPMALAPAMNRAMWSNPATQENVQCLLRRGLKLFGPAEGGQACGEFGPGRMLEPADICLATARLFQTQSLAGRTVLVSAGPTREPIDPVRYVGNRSSGKMGYCLVQSALAAGAEVTLVSGPVALAAPAKAHLVSVETAEEMYRAVLDEVPRHDIYIGAAAVADYSPISMAGHKIKKTGATLSLELARTRDILASVATLPAPPFTVGFAAETKDLEVYAQSKLVEKKLDMIAANRVGGGTGGFERDENALTVFWPGGNRQLPMASKQTIADQLIELIAEHYLAKNPTKNP